MLTMLSAFAVLDASAAVSCENMLLLGDSITYGNGLEGKNEDARNYGTLLRDYFEIKPENYKNAAVDGATSADLVKTVTTMADDIKQADIIIISIGGGDMLALLQDAANKVLDGKFNNMAQLFEIFKNSAQLKTFKSQLSEEKATAILSVLASNLNSIISFIRSNNENAEVIFLTQYDPFSGLDGMDAISDLAQGAIYMLNDTIRMQAEEGGCTCIDVFTPFLGNAKEWTNVLQYNIYPNEEGHYQIFKTLAKYLDTKIEIMAPDTTEAVTTAEVTTTPADTTIPAESSETTSDAPVTDVTEKGGCGSAVATGILAMASLCGVAVCKKKK